ncbi:hypothetical protein Barb6_01260 [Bacteroidales bacterium Barb6]|nr:hypothetical protein Barb6_01260 [Bacteroidales bacterium Barb6]
MSSFDWESEKIALDEDEKTYYDFNPLGTLTAYWLDYEGWYKESGAYSFDGRVITLTTGQESVQSKVIKLTKTELVVEQSDGKYVERYWMKKKPIPSDVSANAKDYVDE